MADDLRPGKFARTPLFTEEEIRNVREGDANGLKSMFPSRFYHDPELYEIEVNHILKKNWLAIGRWDWAEKPGDYFTIDMFGEPLLIVRDKKGKLHCHVNVCKHRWAKIMLSGEGHANLLVCPYHSWTYELDGQLRGVTVEDIPNFNKKDCKLDSLPLEEWNGFIFINFDQNAKPLAPQLEPINKYVGRFQMDRMRTAGRTDYETQWNYKFSFETGYEAYHHEGVHKTLLLNTAKYHHPIEFGELWGVYTGEYPPEESAAVEHTYGRPPWMSEEEFANSRDHSLFVGIYPNLIMYATEYQVSFIVTQFKEVAQNRATTAICIADWAWDRPGAQEKIDHMVDMMKAVKIQDSEGCRMLQGGIKSSYAKSSVIHPLEGTLSHYYGWMMDQFQKAEKEGL